MKDLELELSQRVAKLIQKERSFDPFLHQKLFHYGLQCETITEFGVRWVESTFSFLHSKPKKLRSYDIIHPDTFKLLRPNGEIEHNGKENLSEAYRFADGLNIDFKLIIGNTLEVDIDQTDLLFIDTEHSFLQLKHELFRHNHKVNKFIVMHDTKTHAKADDHGYNERNSLPEIDPGDHNKSGLDAAIKDFLSSTDSWEMEEFVNAGQGLTIIKRI